MMLLPLPSPIPPFDRGFSLRGYSHARSRFYNQRGLVVPRGFEPLLGVKSLFLVRGHIGGGSPSFCEDGHRGSNLYF